MSRDDELARTATATSSPPIPAAPVGATLGRYRLERELGAGGMGVVHAAFDPDLERRVALKVLRNAADGDEARQRLLREARAMARLAHPNVVVVHEVGSAGGRDYVAMELVDGTTVDEWLHAAPRTRAEICEVFDAAGRGLAAAPAAGLVHRDFKPHNVLRGRDGRVVVTDFGLARGADDAADPLAETQQVSHDGEPMRASASPSASSSSPLSSLTRTGSVLGTPAYMAPEQWRGRVGPASDQFAYCVALWEALAGQRPFRGDNATALRAAIEHGAPAAELAKLPRHVRAALWRGLDPDPAKRWPTMDALLAALRTAERRGRIIAQVAVSAAVAAALFVAIAALTYRSDPAIVVPPVFVCPAPALDPQAVWSAAASAQLTAAGQGPAATQLTADRDRWITARAGACQLGERGAEQRACLDGVLGRFDAVARGVEAFAAPGGGASGSGIDHVDAGELLIDPAVCASPTIPRLVAPSPPLRQVIARWLRDRTTREPPDRDALHAVMDSVAADPCAHALAARLVIGAEESSLARAPLVERAAADAELCADERVRADVAIAQAADVVGSEMLDVSTRSKMQHAETAVARVQQADLVAALDLIRQAIAQRNDDPEGAIPRLDAAAAGFTARGRVAAATRAAYEAIRVRRQRAHPDDVEATGTRLAALRQTAAAALGESDATVAILDRALAIDAFDLGDVRGAHAKLDALRRPAPQRHPRHVVAHVVDTAGAPVAGARVTVGADLRGDGITAVFAWPNGADQRVATTDASGTAVFDDAPRDGAVVAESGALRAWGVPIADDVKIVVTPTTRLSGHVDLHGASPRNIGIYVRDPSRISFRDYLILAPVDPSGRFSIDGVPRGPAEVNAMSLRSHGPTTATAYTRAVGAEVGGIALALPTSSRVVHVIVRSTVDAGPGNAEIVLLGGKARAAMTAAEVSRIAGNRVIRIARAIDGEHAPPAVLARAHPGDLFSTVTDVASGDVTACAIALPSEDNPELDRKIEHSYDKLTFRCVPVPPDAEAVTIEIPPWPRLD